uniref:Uncharacterized protein n=1 Tax=Malurus cyaneus samueli TaxID=2593467 RepID=A0A8C5TNP4_9PASS
TIPLTAAPPAQLQPRPGFARTEPNLTRFLTGTQRIPEPLPRGQNDTVTAPFPNLLLSDQTGQRRCFDQEIVDMSTMCQNEHNIKEKAQGNRESILGGGKECKMNMANPENNRNVNNNGNNNNNPIPAHGPCSSGNPECSKPSLQL